MTRRPLIVAHRGASIDEPEHTLEAYRQAILDGADALECDVRLTSDGHLVLVHDRRIDRTSDGQGVVSARTLADLQRHRYDRTHNAGHGVWDDVEDPGVERRHGVVTFAMLLDLVASADRPVGLSVETKHPTRYAGYVEEEVVRALAGAGLVPASAASSARARVMSFSMLAVRRVARLAPTLPTVFLMDRVPVRMRDGTLPRGARASGPSVDILRAHPEYVAKVHDRGHEVHVWTVDRPVDVELCLGLGVDAIITNRPGPVRSLVDAAT